MSINFKNRNPQTGAPTLSGMLGSFKSTITLVLAALFLCAVFLLLTVRVQKVEGTEVGVKVNNLNGEKTVIAESGTHIYNGWLNSFYLLDMTRQRLEMTADSERGSREDRNDLRIKTVDGSDVYADLTINYELRPDMIEQVIETSGTGDTYKVKWVRDYARSVCRTVFGEMTTEEFYDASIRNAKATEAEQELNTLLRPYGIEIVQVIAEKFRFHPEYEEKIRAKKLADQEVEEQISRANAERQNQLYRTVEAEKKKEVLLASFKGEMEQRVVEATAQAERSVREAEAYAISTRQGADAQYYRMEQNAQAIRATRIAEAEGTKKMAEALSGQGGVNIVKMEYARRLKDMEISGQPFSVDGHTERFNLIGEQSPAPSQARNQ